MIPGFLDRLASEQIDPIAHSGRGLWSLTHPLRFVDGLGREFVVPVGFETDYCSVPRVVFAYALAGDRFHAAGALHDYLVRHVVVPRSEADSLFLEAMLSLIPETIPRIPEREYESPEKLRHIAGVMYRAVAAYTRNLDTRGKWDEEIL